MEGNSKNLTAQEHAAKLKSDFNNSQSTSCLLGNILLKTLKELAKISASFCVFTAFAFGAPPLLTGMAIALYAASTGYVLHNRNNFRLHKEFLYQAAQGVFLVGTLSVFLGALNLGVDYGTDIIRDQFLPEPV